MLKWIFENASTILVSTTLICVCAVIVRSMIKRKKQGKSSCGCGCQSCAVSHMCHGKR